MIKVINIHIGVICIYASVCCFTKEMRSGQDQDAASFAVEVPHGSKVNLDGVIEKEEWSAACETTLRTGGNVFIMHDRRNIYVGVRGVEMGWSHICIKTPTEILILHSSAALGKAKYIVGADGVASLKDGFTWEMRDTSQSDSAREVRDKYLDSNKWVATTAWMGNPFEREYTISKDIFNSNEPRIAIVYTSDEEVPEYYCFPDILSDASLNEDLALGAAPERLVFNHEQWARIRFR